MKIAVTGAFSYSGKYITKRLLAGGEEVITLTGHPNHPDPFNGKVKAYPLNFVETSMTHSLQGVDVLVNTYWVRFDKGENTQPRAVENTRKLVNAAKAAGVKRIVHISIANPSADSHLPYYWGKAANEKTVIGSGLSYAILRPTVLFGNEDILINNIAFLTFFQNGTDGGIKIRLGCVVIFTVSQFAGAVDQAHARQCADLCADSAFRESRFLHDLVQ